jgi:hypothetical protein
MHTDETQIKTGEKDFSLQPVTQQRLINFGRVRASNTSALSFNQFVFHLCPSVAEKSS